MSDLSKAAKAIQDFAKCKHEWWRCESCGCKTTSKGVDGLCNEKNDGESIVAQLDDDSLQQLVKILNHRVRELRQRVVELEDASYLNLTLEAEKARLRELLIEVQNCFGVSMRGSTYNEVQIPHAWYDAVEEVLKGVDQ